MFEKLVVTKTPCPHYPNGKIFIYSYHYEETDFKSVDELIAYHKGCEDYGIAYSGLDDYVTLHFPATAKDRTIYRTVFEETPGVGILIFNMPEMKVS
jgi:hypothetical protein